MRRISPERDGEVAFRPTGADPGCDADPRLALWAAFFRRFAAGLLGALRGIVHLRLPPSIEATHLAFNAAALLNTRHQTNRCSLLHRRRHVAHSNIFPCQSLGAGVAGCCNELLQVFGIVDVHSNPRQVQYQARLPCGLSRGVVRLEAVISETERE